MAWSLLKYSQKLLEEEIQNVEKVDANISIKADGIQASYGTFKNTTLNVFLLTDGEDIADLIIQLVQSNNQAQTRIYTLGIGQGSDKCLIKSVAEVGNGKYQIVSDQEDINEKVMTYQSFHQHHIYNLCSLCYSKSRMNGFKKNQEPTIQILFSMEQLSENLKFNINCFDPQNKKKYNILQIQTQINLQKMNIFTNLQHINSLGIMKTQESEFYQTQQGES